jgi:uncharacterized membrane protein YhfC
MLQRKISKIAGEYGVRFKGIRVVMIGGTSSVAVAIIGSAIRGKSAEIEGAIIPEHLR